MVMSVGAKRRGWLLVSAGLVSVLAVGVGGVRAAADAKQVRDPRVGTPLAGEQSGDRLRADVTIRHRRFTNEGALVPGEAPPLRLRLDRRSRQGRWKTTIEVVDSGRPMALGAGGLVAIDNPFQPSRIEIDDEGGATIIARNGRAIAGATDGDRRLMALPDALRYRVRAVERGMRAGAGGASGGLIVEGRLRADRRAGFERKFGKAVGRVRGLDRFVSESAGATEEVLVTPDSALPVEVNSVAGGVLMRRVELAYTPRGDGHVRRAIRTEQPLEGTEQGRMVTDVEFSNITLLDGGAE